LRSFSAALLYLVHGHEHPDLEAKYVVVQPDVFDADPKRGRVPIGGRHPNAVSLGRAESPELWLGPEVSRDHCSIDASGDSLVIDDYSTNGTRVKLHPKDVQHLEFG
jgi:hypothetical protein